MKEEPKPQITQRDYETIREWVENQNTEQFDVIASLITTNPFPELTSQYADFHEQVVSLIKDYGIQLKRVTFEETIHYEDTVQLYVPADLTHDEIWDEWVSSRDLSDIQVDLHLYGALEADHSSLDINEKVVLRLPSYEQTK